MPLGIGKDCEYQAKGNYNLCLTCWVRFSLHAGFWSPPTRCEVNFCTYPTMGRVHLVQPGRVCEIYKRRGHLLSIRNTEAGTWGLAYIMGGEF